MMGLPSDVDAEPRLREMACIAVAKCVSETEVCFNAIDKFWHAWVSDVPVKEIEDRAASPA